MNKNLIRIKEVIHSVLNSKESTLSPNDKENLSQALDDLEKNKEALSKEDLSNVVMKIIKALGLKLLMDGIDNSD